MCQMPERRRTVSKPNNLTGQRFGRLVVIRRVQNNEKGNTVWCCRCDCGKEVDIVGYSRLLQKPIKERRLRIKRRKLGFTVFGKESSIDALIPIQKIFHITGGEE